MGIKKLGLSSLMVSDIKKSTKFYTDILGLKIIKSNPEYGWFELSAIEEGPTIALEQSTEEQRNQAGANAIISMLVDNIMETKKDLELKGVKFLTNVIEVPGQLKLALFKDLDGNKFYLIEELK